MHRRSVLASVGTLLVAGCLAEGGPDGSSDEPDIDASLERVESITHERMHVARTNDTPAWAASVGRPAGDAALFDGAGATLDRVPFEHVDAEREDDVRSFVETTDFDRARLLYVVAVGRGNTEVTVGVDRLGVHDGRLVGSMAVQHADPGDSVDTYASVLVRATGDDEHSPPDNATVRIESINDRDTVVETSVE